MPYIPKEHEKYNLLPLCRQDGGEVFEYPAELINEAEELIGSSSGLFPYNYDSYGEYNIWVDSLINHYIDNDSIVEKLLQVKAKVTEMNRKEDWSILRYIGPSEYNEYRLTNGQCYYWPTMARNPQYQGVVDDEEFTSYLYPTESCLWEILEDPTGMAYRTIYKKGDGSMSVEEYEVMIAEYSKCLDDKPMR